MPKPKTDRERFRLALKGENAGRPPLWVMRQAGRYLPEYRALKEQYDFLTMVKTPELAVEVTLQPLARFDLDAAILFSDILVIPEAMGQAYRFREKGGIEMEFSLASQKDFDRIREIEAKNRLQYVEQSLRILRARLGQSKALLGFCGSPWTLACYMVDGGSSDGFPKTLALAKEQPVLFGSLMEKITNTLAGYLRMQFEAGVDALQIFDSWHSLCPEDKAWEWSLKWIHQVIREGNEKGSVILYAKSPQDRIGLLAESGADALSIDEKADLGKTRSILPQPFALQGNLRPELLETNPSQVRRETHELLRKMKGDKAHVLNLGHGIRPAAKIECMEALVSANQGFDEHFQ